MIIETQLTVPAGKLESNPIKIDLGAILIAEGRQGEVAFVTPAKAPELLMAFNEAWSLLSKIVSGLTAEHTEAEKQAERRKARLLVDEVNGILKTKGVASTADTRQAVIDLDDEYQLLQDNRDQIKAVLELMKGKLKSMENSFTSVKKIIGDNSSHNYGKPHVGGGTDRPQSQPGQPPARQVTPQQNPTPPARSGWGTPKYGNK